MSPRIAQIIATVGYAGYLKPAPGSWGSAVALGLALLLYQIGGMWLVILLTPLAYLAGWAATVRLTRGAEDHDPSEIVIDELVGQWIALFPVLIGASHVGAAITALWPGLVAAFLLFRAFDITKPGPVGWADRRNDATGVMLDDVIAGGMAALCVMLLAALWHGVLL